VTRRRTELGLSTEELARRAGVDAWFLAYFEESADTALCGGALLRVADALETTPFVLEGGEVDRPPGPGRAGPRPVLQVLSSDECERHLGAGGVGRIVFTTGQGPVAIPVNFVWDGGAIVFRTDQAMARIIVGGGVVAFEADHIDESMSEGWSVLVRGDARLVEDPEERQRLVSLHIEPWAGGARHSLIEITPFELTGRVISQRTTADPVPVHHPDRSVTS
jgi:hypothetical protein